MSWNHDLSGDIEAELSRLLEDINALGIRADSEVGLLRDAIACGKRSTYSALQEVAAEVWHAQHPCKLPLLDDNIHSLLDHLGLDDLLGISLACKQLNSARRARFPVMRTLARSSLRSVQLREWAIALGCPERATFPCWAEVTGLTGAVDLNGRVCRILGPANSSGRHPIELDTGYGSLDPGIRLGVGQRPGQEFAPGMPAPLPSDLTSASRKLVRLANLRVLPNSELRAMVVAEPNNWGQTSLNNWGQPVMRSAWVPLRHSVIVHMRAWELGGKAAQDQVERAANNGNLNPWAQLNCGTGGFMASLSELGWEHEPLRPDPGAFEDFLPSSGPVYRSDFMQMIGLAPTVFAQQVSGTGQGTNNTMSHYLMSSPFYAPPIQSMWLAAGPVAFYSTTEDLAMEEVQWAWLYACVLYQRDFHGSADEYLALFSPVSFTEWASQQKALGSVKEGFDRLVRVA